MTGRPFMTVCLFGDGAVAEGEFHECLNLAALWHLPVLFCCENNRYAMGTRIDRAHASSTWPSRAAAYGLIADAVDGMDVLAVRPAATSAVQRCRAGNGPQFLELQTYRFRAHSMYDPDRYRDKGEIAKWRSVTRSGVGRRLRAAGVLSEERMSTMDEKVTAEVDAAVAAAETAPIRAG